MPIRTGRAERSGSRLPALATSVSISVRDEGAGLPPGFDRDKPKGLGMRIITAFVKQLDGTLEIHARHPGTEFVVTIPR